MARTIVPLVYAALKATGWMSLFELYELMDIDIPTYQAVSVLVRIGAIEGPDPYSVNAPSSMRDSYYRIAGTPTQGSLSF
jgi:hypothetical protein